MTGPRQFDIEIDEAAYSAFWRMTCSRAYKRSLLRWTALLLILLVLGLALGKSGAPLVAGAAGGWIALIIFLAVNWLLIPRRARKEFHQTKHFSPAQHIEVDVNEMRYKSKLANGCVPWDHFVKWEESSTLLAIYANSAVAFLMPKTQVDPETIGFMRQQLVDTGLPKKGKLRK